MRDLLSVRPFVLLTALSVLLTACAEKAPIDPGEQPTDDDFSLLSSLYTRLPDPDDCDAGELAAAERDTVLNYINEVRAAHGLPAVAYAAEHDAEVTATALITVANNVLTHDPTSDLSCWSAEGKRGAAASNIGWATRTGTDTEAAFSTRYMIDLWWNDDGTPSVGHRRWMLNPFLTAIAFGRVDRPMTESEAGVTGTAIWVINDEQADIRSLGIDHVAYPYEMTPRHRFNSKAELSFSALVRKDSIWANRNVDLSSATIRITDPSGEEIDVSDLKRLNDGAGLANALVWKSPVEVGVRYDVTVSGVEYEGVERGYTYWFEVE